MTFEEKFENRADKVNSLVSVSLDSVHDVLPERFKKEQNPQFEFNKWIIEETQPFTSVYKFNMAFYEARGAKGYEELLMTLKFLHEHYPDIPLISDCKRGDVENTNMAYAESIFDYFGFDGATLSPYLGSEPLEPFLERRDKGCFILCRTSNPGAGEIQDLQIDGEPLWWHVAKKVVNDWNKNENCMMVVGATYPKEMDKIRKMAGDMIFLSPGAGKQGANVEAIMRAGLNFRKKGIIVSSGRGIIFARNPAQETMLLRDQINNFR
jgi:orotidine-5'-phosphate decarboxylase